MLGSSRKRPNTLIEVPSRPKNEQELPNSLGVSTIHVTLIRSTLYGNERYEPRRDANRSVLLPPGHFHSPEIIIV